METTARNISETVVAVVGGAGFLGSHLVNHLIDDRNCTVIVLDNLITGQKRFVHPKAEFIYCDITQSEERMRRIFEDRNVEYVFNYAAEPYIPVSFTRPLHVFDTNARAALMVMNAAQEAGVKGILQVSSAEIYGDAAQEAGHALHEGDEVHPHSTYGAAKAAVDYLVQCRWREAKTPAVAMRQFNCVGERETHPYVIPEIIKQINEAPLRDGTYKTIYLGNNSKRDFQYAGDAVRMAVELLEQGEFGAVYNMGSESTIAIYDLAVLVGKLMGVDVQVVEDETRKRPWEIWYLKSDNAKLYGTIKARPSVSLEEALTRTIEWFKENGNAWDF